MGKNHGGAPFVLNTDWMDARADLIAGPANSTVKTLKIGTQKSHRNCPKNRTIWFYNPAITLKDTAGMANSVCIDQTALLRSMPALFANAHQSQYIKFYGNNTSFIPYI
ncbi:MAG: hypothetical protein AB2693_32760 [Candidatus Thiodiazotropha sp.]